MDILRSTTRSKSIGQSEFERVGISSIRKRALTKVLDRLERHETSFTRMLERAPSDLSSSQRFAAANQFENIKAARLRLRGVLDDAERFSDAERKRLATLKSLGRPLQPARRPVATAIAGLLERHRRQLAALSRDQFSRVQAKAAARRKYDLARAYRISGTPYSQSPGAFRGEADFFDLRGVDSDLLDPCAKADARSSVRRSVMFAQRSISGYPVRHRKIPGC